MALPVLADVKSYMGETSYDDSTLTAALAAETAAQARSCRIPSPYPDDLREALLRRVARNIALRGQPLGVLEGDGGSVAGFLPRQDPEVRRLEAPFRRLTFG